MGGVAARAGIEVSAPAVGVGIVVGAAGYGKKTIQEVYQLAKWKKLEYTEQDLKTLK